MQTTFRVFFVLFESKSYLRLRLIWAEKGHQQAEAFLFKCRPTYLIARTSYSVALTDRTKCRRHFVF